MLSGKVALVTGAAQGIGLATTKQLLASGAKVAVLDISGETLVKTCEELRKEYGADSVLDLRCDVTDKEALVKAFQKTKDSFSTLDIVVNNAGYADEKDWERILQINLHAVIHGTYLAVDHMSKRKGFGGGVVVNMASLAGIIPHPGSRAYTASKAGVIGFTRAMGLALPLDGVRVNCICPAYVDTGFIPRDEKTSKFREIALKKQGGWLSPEFVAQGIMKLITETSLNLQVMTVTPVQGYVLREYNEELAITVEDILS